MACIVQPSASQTKFTSAQVSFRASKMRFSVSPSKLHSNIFGVQLWKPRQPYVAPEKLLSSAAFTRDALHCPRPLASLLVAGQPLQSNAHAAVVFFIQGLDQQQPPNNARRAAHRRCSWMESLSVCLQGQRPQTHAR